MSSADEYRVKFAELRAKAQHESDPKLRAELEALALGYFRLISYAEHNQTLDLVYETPPVDRVPDVS